MAIDFSQYQVGNAQKPAQKETKKTGTTSGIDFAKYQVTTPKPQQQETKVAATPYIRKPSALEQFATGQSFIKQQQKTADLFPKKQETKPAFTIKLPESGKTVSAISKLQQEFDLAPSQTVTSAKEAPISMQELDRRSEKARKNIEYYSEQAVAERRRKINEEIQAVARDTRPGYKEPGLFGQIGDEIKSATVGIASTLGANIEMIGNANQIMLLTEAGQKLQKKADKTLASNPEWRYETDGWNTTKVTRLVAGAVPSLLAVTVATLVAGPAGGVGVGFALGSGATYKEAIQSGASEKVATNSAITVGSINGVLESIFPGAKLTKGAAQAVAKSLYNDLKKQAVKYGLKVLEDGTIEGTTEAMQELVSNVIAQNYDKDRKLWDNVFESFVGGFGSGAAVGATIPDGEYTPQEVIDKVATTELKNTPDGKELIKKAVEAQQSGLTIKIESGKGIAEQVQKTKPKIATTQVQPEKKKAVTNDKTEVQPTKYKSAEEVDSLFRKDVGKSIMNAKGEIAGIEVRNNMRRAGNLDGAMEIPRFTPKQISMIDSYDKLKYPSSKYLFHTTPTINLESIAKEGLVTGKPARFEGVSSKNKISLSANEEAANYYGGNADTMIRVNKSYARKMDLQPDLLAGGEGVYVTSKNIPPNQLEIKRGNKWVKLTDIYTTPTKEVDPLEALKTEARKYKSAEEFIKAQGQPLYHGTNAEFKVFDKSKIGTATDEGFFGRGFYFANTKDFARVAPGGRGAKNIMEVYPSSDAKLFDISKTKDKKEMADLLNMSEDSLIQDPNGIIRPIRGQSGQFTSHVKDLGYDGVVVNRGGDAIETVIFEPEKIKTKSQLTDLYNQATAETKPAEKKVTPVKKKEVVKKPVEKKAVEPKKTTKTASRVFERLKEENKDINGELLYTPITLKKESEKATNLIVKDKQKAYRIAMGEETSNTLTSTAVNIALAEEALREGNTKLYLRLTKNRSLAQTRRGQEIVSEKASVTDNSTARYVKELLANKLEGVGRTYLKDIRVKGKTNKENASDVIDRKVATLETKIKTKKLDISTALKLLDEITCV